MRRMKKKVEEQIPILKNQQSAGCGIEELDRDGKRKVGAKRLISSNLHLTHQAPHLTEMYLRLMGDPALTLTLWRCYTHCSWRRQALSTTPVDTPTGVERRGESELG